MLRTHRIVVLTLLSLNSFEWNRRYEGTMLRTRPIASFALVSLLIGLLQSAATPIAGRADSPSYAGTIASATDNFWPPVPTMLGYNLGDPPLWDAPLILDQHGHYYADLASVVPTTSNGGISVVGGNEVVTVHLKPGMRWSDGSPITPADYVGSQLLQSSPVIGDGPSLATSSDCSGNNGPVKSLSATGTTLTVTFSGIFAPALDGCIPAPTPVEYYQRKYHIQLPAGLLASFQADRATALYTSPTYQRSPLGRLLAACEQDQYTSPKDLFSGPYKLGSWTPGRRGVMIPNPYYTALPPDPRHPRPARIVYEVLATDRASFLQDLAQPATYAHIDYALDYADGDFDCAVAPALRRSRYRVLAGPSFGLEHLELNQANPALRDQRVRQALMYGIDKAAYMRAVCPTLTTTEQERLAQTSVIPAASPWSNNSDLPQNLYNAAKAKALLAAAGYASSPGGGGRHLQFDFYTTGSPYRRRSAQELQRQWARLGITLILHFATQSGPGGLFAPCSEGGVLARRRYDLAEFAWGLAVEVGPSFSVLLDPSQISDRNHPDGWNWAGVRDLALLGYLTRAQGTIDEQQRHRLVDQFQNDMVDKAYWIPLFTQLALGVVKPTLGNFKPNVYGGPWWNTFEWYQGATG
jgi:peptide/nickel transport system substrate-binding protein